MTTSSVRIVNSNGDQTATYSNLYGVRLDGLPFGLPATPLAHALLGIAREGRPGGDDGSALADDQFSQVALVAQTGFGQFITPSGWTVTVTHDDLTLRSDEYRATSAEYVGASTAMQAAAYTELRRLALLAFPNAVALVTEGRWTEDGELHLDITEVYVPGTTARYPTSGDRYDVNAPLVCDRLSAEDGNDDVHALNDSLIDVLGTLVETSGDDWQGRTAVDLGD